MTQSKNIYLNISLIYSRFIITPNSAYTASSSAAAAPAVESTNSNSAAPAATTSSLSTPSVKPSSASRPPPPPAAAANASKVPPPPPTTTATTANPSKSKTSSPLNSLPPISLPQDNQWNVYITSINSTTNVFLRLLGDEYSQKFDNLATDMELFYFHDTKMEPVSQPEVKQRHSAEKKRKRYERK